jgi:hypothetical protein
VVEGDQIDSKRMIGILPQKKPEIEALDSRMGALERRVGH